MNRTNNYTIITIFIVQLLLISCTEKHGGMITVQSDMNGDISGRVCTVDGAPVNNANVYLIPDNYMPNSSGKQALTDPVRSDAQGRFFISVANNGIYNLFAETEALTGMQHSLYVSTGEPFLLKNSCVLTTPGSLTGTVHLQDTVASEAAVILLPGTNRYAIPDTSGLFLFPVLAQGTYQVTMLSMASGYTDFDTMVTIPSGTSISLAPVALEKIPYPTITALTTHYDTALMNVTLSWEVEHPSRVESIAIYCNREKNLVPIKRVSGATTTATFCVVSNTVDEHVFQLEITDKNGWRSTPVLSDTVVTMRYCTGNVLSIPGDVSTVIELDWDAKLHDGYLYYIGFRTLFKIDLENSVVNTYDLRYDSAGFVSDDLFTLNPFSGKLFLINMCFRNRLSTSFGAVDSGKIGIAITEFDQDLNIIQHHAIPYTYESDNETFTPYHSIVTASTDHFLICRPLVDSGSVDSTQMQVLDDQYTTIAESVAPGFLRIREVQTFGDTIVAVIKKLAELTQADTSTAPIIGVPRPIFSIHEVAYYDRQFTRIGSFIPDPTALKRVLPEGSAVDDHFVRIGPNGLFFLRGRVHNSVSDSAINVLYCIDTANTLVACLPISGHILFDSGTGQVLAIQKSQIIHYDIDWLMLKQ